MLITVQFSAIDFIIPIRWWTSQFDVYVSSWAQERCVIHIHYNTVQSWLYERKRAITNYIPYCNVSISRPMTRLTTATVQWTSPRTTRHVCLEWNYRPLQHSRQKGRHRTEKVGHELNAGRYCCCCSSGGGFFRGTNMSSNKPPVDNNNRYIGLRLFHEDMLLQNVSISCSSRVVF